MTPSTRKHIHPALPFVLTVGWIVLVRLSFAVLRYTTDLKHAPVFSVYLEDGIRMAGYGVFTMLALRARMSWAWWLLLALGSTALAGLVYRVIAASFGREFYSYLSPRVPLTMGSLFYSMIPGLLLMGVFWAGHAYYQRWK